MPTSAIFEHTGNMMDTESIATENTELSGFNEEIHERERVFYEVPQGSQAGEIRNICNDNGEEMGSQRGRDRAPQVKAGGCSGGTAVLAFPENHLMLRNVECFAQPKYPRRYLTLRSADYGVRVFLSA